MSKFLCAPPTCASPRCIDPACGEHQREAQFRASMAHMESEKGFSQQEIEDCLQNRGPPENGGYPPPDEHGSSRADAFARLGSSYTSASFHVSLSVSFRPVSLEGNQNQGFPNTQRAHASGSERQALGRDVPMPESCVAGPSRAWGHHRPYCPSDFLENSCCVCFV